MQFAEKKALKRPANKIKKHKANTKKPTLLRGKAKYKLFKNDDCFQSHFETSTSGEKIWICLVFLFFLDKAQSLSFIAFRLDLEQEAFFTCDSTFKVHDSSGVHRGGRFNQSRWHLDQCVMTQPCHTLWLLLINMSYRSSGVEWYVLTEMSYMPFWQNECVSSACVWMWLQHTLVGVGGDWRRLLGIELHSDWVCVNWRCSVWECLARPQRYPAERESCLMWPWIEILPTPQTHPGLWCQRVTQSPRSVRGTYLPRMPGNLTIPCQLCRLHCPEEKLKADTAAGLQRGNSD